MIDLAASVVVWGAGTALLMVWVRTLPAQDAAWVWWSWALHAVSWIAQILIVRIVYRGEADMLWYHQVGAEIARSAFDDPRVVGEMIKAVFQQDPTFSMFIGGGATMSMVGIVSLVELFCGMSLWATAAAFTMGSALAKFLVYDMIRTRFPAQLRDQLAIACLLVPSYVFWTSAILKETVAVIGGALILAGFALLARARLVPAAVLIAVGSVAAAVVKPYLLIVSLLAGGAYAGWSTLTARGRVMSTTNLLAGLALAIVGVLLVGRVFPQFSIEAIDETASSHQSVGHTAQREGSYYAIGTPGGGTLAQLPYIPLALIAGLYRPFLFESRNLVMLVNGLETAAFTVYSIRTLSARGWAELVRVVRSEPVLVYSFVFVVVLAIGTGFTSSNLGTLSRYRSPLVPYFALLLAVWSRSDLVARKSS